MGCIYHEVLDSSRLSIELIYDWEEESDGSVEDYCNALLERRS